MMENLISPKLHKGEPVSKLYTRLDIIPVLSHELSSRSVSFCHWKSNEHLLAAVAGETDLDVLFEEADRPRVLDALAAAGFRRGRAVWHRCYPLIEDYLAIDAVTGKLVHVHAHFRLLVGEESVKSFHLPWEAELLETRQRDEEAGFYVAEPARELLLLMVRSSIKERYPSLRKRLASPTNSDIVSDEQREFVWLKQRVAQSALAKVAARLFGARAVPVVEAVYVEGIRPQNLAALFSACGMNRFLRRGRVATWFVRWLRWIAGVSAVLARRLGLIVRPSRRRIVDGGLIVAVLGADGSGKSTLVKALDAELSKKIDVLRLYLGSGDGPSSALRWPLAQLRRRRHERKARRDVTAVSGDIERGVSRSLLFHVVKECERIWWAVALAREKRSKLRVAAHARASGKIVLTDRYPQSTIGGFNDGPLLGDLAPSEWWPLRWLSRWEQSNYTPNHVPQPDLVLKLIGSSQVLHRRRLDMTPDVISEKQQGILNVAFGPLTRVVQIDADRSASEVLTAAMTAIGAVFSSQSTASASGSMRKVDVAG